MLLGHNFLNYLKQRLNYHSIYRGLNSSEGVMSVSLPLDEERGESSVAAEGEEQLIVRCCHVRHIIDIWCAIYS